MVEILVHKCRKASYTRSLNDKPISISNENVSMPMLMLSFIKFLLDDTNKWLRSLIYHLNHASFRILYTILKFIHKICCTGDELMAEKFIIPFNYKCCPVLYTILRFDQNLFMKFSPVPEMNCYSLLITTNS